MADKLKDCEVSALSLALSIVTQNDELTRTLIRYAEEANVQDLYADVLKLEGGKGAKKSARNASLKSQSAELKFKSIVYGTILSGTTQGKDAIDTLMREIAKTGENAMVGINLNRMMQTASISEVRNIAKVLGVDTEQARAALDAFNKKVAFYNGTNYSLITGNEIVKAGRESKAELDKLKKLKGELGKAEQTAEEAGKTTKKELDGDAKAIDKFKKSYWTTTKGKNTLRELGVKYGIDRPTYLSITKKVDTLKGAEKKLKDTKAEIEVVEKTYKELLEKDFEEINKGQNPYSFMSADEEWKFNKSYNKTTNEIAMQYGNYALARAILADPNGELPDSVYKVIKETVEKATGSGVKNSMGVKLTEQWILDENRTLEELMSRAFLNTEDLITNGQLRTIYRQRLIELASAGTLKGKDVKFVETLIQTAKFSEAGGGFSSILRDVQLADTAINMGLDLGTADGKNIREGVMKIFKDKSFNRLIKSGQPIHLYGKILVNSRQLLELAATMLGDLNIHKAIVSEKYADSDLLKIAGVYLSGDTALGNNKLINLIKAARSTPTSDDSVGTILKAITGVDVPDGSPIAFFDTRRDYSTSEGTGARANFMSRLAEGNQLTVTDKIQDITGTEGKIRKILEGDEWENGGFVVVNGSDWKQSAILNDVINDINLGRADGKKIIPLFPKGKSANSFALVDGKLVYRSTSNKMFEAFINRVAIRTLGDTALDSRVTEELMQRMLRGDVDAILEYNKLLEEDAKKYFASMLGVATDDEKLIPLIEQKTGISFKNYDALEDKKEFWKLVDSKFTLWERTTGKFTTEVVKADDIISKIKGMSADELSKELNKEFGFSINPEQLIKDGSINDDVVNAYINFSLSTNPVEYLENKGTILAVLSGSGGDVMNIRDFKGMLSSGDYTMYKQIFFNNPNMTDEELAKYVKSINDMIFDGLTQQVASNLINLGYQLPGGINIKEAVYKYIKGDLKYNSPFAQAFLYKNGLQDSTTTIDSIFNEVMPKELDFRYGEKVDVNLPTEKIKVEKTVTTTKKTKELTKEEKVKKVLKLKKKYKAEKLSDIPEEALIKEGLMPSTVEEVIEVEEEVPVQYLTRIVKNDNEFLPSSSYSALTSMVALEDGAKIPNVGHERDILEGILNQYYSAVEKATTDKTLTFAEAQQLKLKASYALDMFEQDILMNKYGRFLSNREKGEMFGLKYQLGIGVNSTDLAQIRELNNAILTRYDNATKRIVKTNNELLKGFIKGKKGIKTELEARMQELIDNGATLKEINGTVVVVDTREEILRGLATLGNAVTGFEELKVLGKGGLEQLTNEQAYFLMNAIDYAKSADNKANIIKEVIYRLNPQLAKLDFFNTFAVENGIPKALAGNLLTNNFFSKYSNLGYFDEEVKKAILKDIEGEFVKRGALKEKKLAGLDKIKAKLKGKKAYDDYVSLEEIVEGAIEKQIKLLSNTIDGKDLKEFKLNAKKTYMGAFNPYTMLEDVPAAVKENIDNILTQQQEGLRTALSMLNSDDQVSDLLNNIYIQQIDGSVLSLRDTIDGKQPSMTKVLFDTDSDFVNGAEINASERITADMSETTKRNIEKTNKDIQKSIENNYLEGLNSYLNESEFIGGREKQLRDRMITTARGVVEKYSTLRKFSEFDNSVTGLNDEIVRDFKSYILGFEGDITEGGNNMFALWGYGWGKNIQENILHRWGEFKQKYSEIYSLSPEQLSIYKPKDNLDRAALNLAVYFKEVESRLGSLNGVTGVAVDMDINKAFGHLGEVVMNVKDVRGVMSLMSGVEGNQVFKFFQFANPGDVSYMPKLRYKGESDDWGVLAGYRKYVDNTDLGMNTDEFNRAFGSNLSGSEHNLVMQALTGATMINKNLKFVHDIINLINGSTYLSRFLLSYPGQLFTIANQSIGYFLKQIGWERELGMEDMAVIDEIRKGSGILNGTYSELNIQGFADYDSTDVLNSFNRYGIPDVEDAYKNGNFYTTDDVETIYGKFDEYFKNSEKNNLYARWDKWSRNTDAYKDNANNLIDGLFARNFKNIAFDKAIKTNNVMQFASATQFKEFMEGGASKKLKDAVMNAVQESAGRNFKNMLGIGFAGLDKSVSGGIGGFTSAGNIMLGLANTLNFRGAWGRNIFRQTNDFLMGALKMSNAGLSEEGIDAVTSYIARQPEFVNFTVQVFNDIKNCWKLSRYQDNGQRPVEDDEYGIMDFLSYMDDNMSFVSQWVQGLNSYGTARIIGDTLESSIMSMRNPEIYKDFYGVGALFNSIASNFGRNWKVADLVVKEAAILNTRGGDAAWYNLQNEFRKLSFGSLRYMIASDVNASGYSTELITSRGGIPGILTGEPDAGGDKQFSYNLANTETWENIKSYYEAKSRGDVEAAEKYAKNNWLTFFNNSKLGGVIKGTLQVVRGQGHESLNKLIGDMGVYDITSPYNLGMFQDLVEETEIGNTITSGKMYVPTETADIKDVVDIIKKRGNFRPGNSSFNKGMFNYDSYGHLGGSDYSNDNDIDMEFLLENMKYERNWDFSFKKDKNGERIVTNEWKVHMNDMKGMGHDEEYMTNSNYKFITNWVESHRNDPNYMLYNSLIAEGVANNWLAQQEEKFIKDFNDFYGLKGTSKLTKTELEDDSGIYYDEFIGGLKTASIGIGGDTYPFVEGIMSISQPATQQAYAKILARQLKEKGSEDLNKFFKIGEDGEFTLSKKYQSYLEEQGKMQKALDEGDLDTFLAESASITNMYQKDDPYGMMTMSLLNSRINRINGADNLSPERKAKAINVLLEGNYEFIQRHIPEMIDSLGYDVAKTYIDNMNTMLYDVAKIGTELTTTNEANNNKSGRGSASNSVKLSNSLRSKLSNTAEKSGITPSVVKYSFEVPQHNASKLLKVTKGKGAIVQDAGNYVTQYKPHSNFEISKDISRGVKKTKTQAISTKKQLSNIEAKTEKALTAEV